MAVDPRRVRRPSRGFGWIDHRVLSGGYLQTLDCPQIAIYFTLCLVADRRGISFYRPESLARIIRRPVTDVASALGELARRGLIARDGWYAQVLELDEVVAGAGPAPHSAPAAPVCSLAPPPLGESVSQSAEQILAGLDPAARERLLLKARQRFERFLGKRVPRSSVLAAAAVSLLREEQLTHRRNS